MGGSTVDGKDGEFIKSPTEMLVRFSVEVTPKLAEWEARLREAPDELEAIEREVQNASLRGAGLLVAGLISVVLQSEELAQSSEATRRGFSHPLAKGRNRKLCMRLLGGVMMWVTSLYCEPKRRLFRDADKPVCGLHIELAQFGFGKKESPGVETRVARTSALCPSFELAQAELNRDGLELSVKAVRRITQHCGEDLLKQRTMMLSQWRAGLLESTDELAGMRVTVQIDGGRTKLRGDLREPTAKAETLNEMGLVCNDVPGRSKAKPRKSFDAEWREPKLVTIFIHNEKGRMVKQSKATIDGTFAGPDAMAELVAMHLHRLGAAQAQSIAFVADGAVWIWDRIESIVREAGIPESVKIHQVLDNCHAAHHVSLALAALGIAEADRMPLYRELRSRLRNGQWRSVVAELQTLAADNPELEKLQTEVNYLRKHGAAGRLAYPTFRGQGIPLGSGAIESSIRRVINLRLKGNGIFWREENAESMLQLRALVISDRWDERIPQMRSCRRKTYLADWHWTPRPMTTKPEPERTANKNAL
jgi:hypothetical protein